ncbi:MAG: hypothetical protein HOA04_08990, partial [Euryarchaeota archaeon]|nr:hypothetical protein [Euryarchaeota archaeon]
PLPETSGWTSSNSLDTSSVAWGDVDGDGDLDLAVGNNGQNNEVYLNQLDDGGAGADGLPEGSNYTGNEWYVADSWFEIDGANDSWDVGINVSNMPANTDFNLTWQVELYYDNLALTILNYSVRNWNWSETTTEHFLTQNWTLSGDLMSIAGRYTEYCLGFTIYHSSTGNAASSGGSCTFHTPPISNDGDWIPDAYEGTIYPPTSSSSLDTDGDGWGDWIEHWGGSDPSVNGMSSTPTDADNDGLPSLLEEMMGTSDNDNDSDGDGALDYDDFRYGGHPARASHLPPNQDWDSCWDYWEDQVGLNSSNPDSDGDGVYDCFESDPWNASSTPTDTDGDGLPDDLESLYNTDASNPDSDGDGVPDSAEIGSGTNPNDVLNYNVNYWSNFGQTLEQFGTATASTTATIYSANNVLDDDHSSYWQPENPCPGWIEIDLGNTYRPSYIEFSIFNEDFDDDYPRDVVIQTREQPSDNWINISSFTFGDEMGLSGSWGDYTELNKVRYVRIYCISSNDDSGVPHDIAFSEITIYDSTNLQYVDLNAIDNQTTGGTGPTGPTDAPIAPIIDSETVISLFSDEYTDVPGTDWSPSWSQSTIYTTEFIAGNNVIKYQNLDYMGVSLSGSQHQDVSEFSHVHFDYWTADPCSNECLRLSLISPGPLENSVSAGTIVTGSWQTVDISLNLYNVPDLSNIFQLKFEGSGTVYIDNLYFYGLVNNDTNNNTDNNTGNNTSNNTNDDTDSDGVTDLFDLCPDTPAGSEVDINGCITIESHEPELEILFTETLDDCELSICPDGEVWFQEVEILLHDPWIGYNHSISITFSDDNGNTLFNYFSPLHRSFADGWHMVYSHPWSLEIELDDDDTIEFWEGTTRPIWINNNSVEFPYFTAGEYCVEVSLGYQIDITDNSMDSVSNLFDSVDYCDTFEHDSLEGVIWEGYEDEPPQSNLEKVMSNKIVSTLLDFMDSTQGQILSIGLAVLGFAGKMVMARGNRAKNKRVTKFSKAIRKADSRGRLKILEMDIEKANNKGKLPRGGFGDLMEQIESRMESLGFDDDPDQGSTSGNWTSGDEIQQASEMMWDAQEMMEEAKEEVKITRQAVEGLQDRLNIDTKYAEEPVSKGPRYERSGVRLSDSAASTGPSLPGSKEGGLEAKPDLVASILSQNIAPKDNCHCGSGKMYKDCHMKRGKKKKNKW